MPLTCSVVGCRSNYKPEKSPYVPISSLPKDPAKRLQWLDTLGFKDDFIPGKNFRVCENHFKKGVVQKFKPIVKPTLVQPASFMKSDPEKRIQGVNIRLMKAQRKFLEQEMIVEFKDLQ